MSITEHGESTGTRVLFRMAQHESRKGAGQATQLRAGRQGA